MRRFLVVLMLTFCVEKHKALADMSFDEKILDDFYINKKFCKRGTKNWDDQCQDKVIEKIYGENWREFKEIIIKFRDELKRDNVEGLISLFTMPFMMVSFTDSTRTMYNIIKCEMPEDFISHYSGIEHKPLNIKYKDIIFVKEVWLMAKYDKNNNPHPLYGKDYRTVWIMVKYGDVEFAFDYFMKNESIHWVSQIAFMSY